MLPFVTVDILAFNRRAEVAETLEHIAALDYPADRLEVVVVDNASEDGTAEMLADRFPSVRVVRSEENVGTSGWNRGFEVGRGDWFLVLDDDCYLEGDGLRRAVEAAEAEGADLVSFGVRSSVDPGFRFDRDYEVGMLSFWGCAALISRRAVEELGGFDPEIFVWGHELDFTLRLLDRGFAHLYLPDVVAVHQKPPHTEGPPPRLARLNAEHQAYLAARLLPVRDAIGVCGSLLVTAAGVGLVQADRRDLIVHTARGIAHGARAHAPVRASVSRLYRRNFNEWTGPLRWWRSPARVLRTWGDPEAARADLDAHLRRFWDARRGVFPQGRTRLQVP